MSDINWRDYEIEQPEQGEEIVVIDQWGCAFAGRFRKGSLYNECWDKYSGCSRQGWRKWARVKIE